MDKTSQKIIDATMPLIRDKGYVATTTKDIARCAGVNECTLFRKFEGKKDIVLQGMKQVKWRANISLELFQDVAWNLEKDLTMYMQVYMNHVTPDFVNLSIGLRAPQIYKESAPMIMKIPEVFLSSLSAYFKEMHNQKKIALQDFEGLAFSFFSMTFGYTFLKASFKDNLINIDSDKFIEQAIHTFLNGIK